MRADKSINSVDIPQINRLSYVRVIVDEFIKGITTPSEISKSTNIPIREVGYAIHAARILNLISEDGTINRLGLMLNRCVRDSQDEINTFIAALKSSIIMEIIPELLASPILTREVIAREIMSRTALSEETARRRAGALIAWRRQLYPNDQLDIFAQPRLELESLMPENEREASSAMVTSNDGASAQINSADLHILRELKLPDRFEQLSALLGTEIAKVLVGPSAAMATALQTAAMSATARGEGAFIPVFGESGAGKTTLASSLTTFFPRQFAPSVQHTGAVSFDALTASVNDMRRRLAANDNRIIPINNDHREGSPPSRAELAEIKRFLRAPSPGSRTMIFWPETTLATANQLSRDYIEIAGQQAIELPLIVAGPDRSIWQSIVKSTLEIVNNITSLETLGVDPTSYDPGAFPTIGKFMRQISVEFNQNLQKLIEQTQIPVSVAIIFASESNESGVLEKLCNTSRLGLLDASSLIAATPGSAIGRWWASRRGLLIQTILQLNAHAFSLGPPASIAALRQYGPTAIRSDLSALGLNAPGPKLLHQTMGRSDIGKFLTGRLSFSSEDRGSPADTSTAAFQLIAEKGFTYGADKSLNQAMSEAWSSYLLDTGVTLNNCIAEKQLSFCNLIPDNALYINDSTSCETVVCLEYTWRKGEFLGSQNKAAAASYILEKLRNYARELHWTVD